MALAVGNARGEHREERRGESQGRQRARTQAAGAAYAQRERHCGTCSSRSAACRHFAVGFHGRGTSSIASVTSSTSASGGVTCSRCGRQVSDLLCFAAVADHRTHAHTQMRGVRRRPGCGIDWPRAGRRRWWPHLCRVQGPRGWAAEGHGCHGRSASGQGTVSVTGGARACLWVGVFTAGSHSACASCLVSADHDKVKGRTMHDIPNVRAKDFVIRRSDVGKICNACYQNNLRWLETPKKEKAPKAKKADSECPDTRARYASILTCTCASQSRSSSVRRWRPVRVSQTD